MKQDKWTQQLHDKLADYQTDAPEGLWEDIEAALQAQAKPQKPRFISLRRWTAAACLASLIATGGYWWYQATDNLKELQSEPAFADATDYVLQDSPAEPLQENPIEPLQDEKKKMVENLPVRQNKENTLLADLETSSNAIAVYDTISNQIKDEAIQEQLAEATPAPKEENQVIRELDKAILDLSNTHKRSVSLNLYAMNGFGTQANSNGVLMSDALLQKFTNDHSYGSSARAVTPVYLAGYEERQKHYQPLSFGLSVSYPLAKRLSVTTGIVFTRLHSEFLYITQNQQISKEQTLCYLGIPLQLNCQLWSYKGLKAYLSAGGQADWNISTSLETNGIVQELDKDRMQWSVNTCLGVEYDIIPQLGLYIEPGLRHYFDNGSRMENFFKDKPTNFNLQFGVRWNLSDIYQK